MTEVIKRGILTNFDSSTYTCSVLLLEATSSYLTSVPAATSFDGTSAQIGDFCAVLFFDESNYTDAVVLCAFPNSNSGIPSPAPGRITFVTGFLQINGSSISSGATSTFTLTGSGSIPGGASGVLYKVQFSSPTAGAFIHLAPHAASDITTYQSAGNIQVASSFVYSGGILQVDSNGKIDIKANIGNCTVWLSTHGYVY